MERTGTSTPQLRAGAPGTSRFAERHGEARFAVRYRYDEANLMRYTTVEIVVDEARRVAERCISDPDRLVGLRIGFEERALRDAMRGVQARWDPAAKLWWVTLAQASHLGLQERIVASGPPRVNISAGR